MSLLADLLGLLRPRRRVVVDDEVEQAKKDIEELREQVDEQGDRLTAVEVKVGVRRGSLRDMRDVG